MSPPVIAQAEEGHGSIAAKSAHNASPMRRALLGVQGAADDDADDGGDSEADDERATIRASEARASKEWRRARSVAKRWHRG